MDGGSLNQPIGYTTVFRGAGEDEPAIEPFNRWLASAPGGDIFVYHVDGQPRAKRWSWLYEKGTGTKPKLEVYINTIGGRAYQAHCDGQVILVQKRTPEGLQYLAIKRRTVLARAA